MTRSEKIKLILLANFSLLCAAAAVFIFLGHLPIFTLTAIFITSVIGIGYLIHEKMAARRPLSPKQVVQAAIQKERKDNPHGPIPSQAHQALRVHLDDQSTSLVMGYLAMPEDLEEDNGPPPVILQRAQAILQEHLKDDKANIVSIVMDYFYDAGKDPEAGKAAAQALFAQKQKAEAEQREILKRQDATRNLGSSESPSEQLADLITTKIDLKI